MSGVNTALEDTMAWVSERLKNSDGDWIANRLPDGESDVMFCILCEMENVQFGSDEYKFLIKTARKFLKAHPSEKETAKLEQRIADDNRLADERVEILMRS